MLTEIKIKNLKPKQTEYTISDTNGLSLRVLPTGRKIFQYRYHLPGQRNRGRRFTYGQWPDLSLAEARALHREAVKKVRQGIDLNLEKRVAATQAAQRKTVLDSFGLYDTEYISRLRKPKEKRRLLAPMLKSIGPLHLESVTRENIVAVLAPIRKAEKLTTANRSLTAMRAFFSYCVESGWMPNNPVDGITRRLAGGVEKPRERFLSESEIRTFWCGLESSNVPEAMQAALRLLLLTGARAGELCGAEWVEIDFENRIWTIPAIRTKTQVENVVPLTDLAAEYFLNLKERARGIQWVLPLRNESGPIAAVRPVQALVKAEHFELEPFTAHDLRRTCSTWLYELGVRPDVAERVLGHAVKGVSRHYNHSVMLNEKRAALNLWAEKILQIAAAEKVISIRREA
ncbi:MAG: tyrosine-type recombinase/integrase [Deltaproteobacteria bacterium]|jgi:integrase|nr:tyrosine-type recombinase/integrase [Deltaproteobacteria bacterium]MBT7155466.1 tyrosine-type recombinase/integrase [Deltaproteobacteria bacterium]